MNNLYIAIAAACGMFFPGIVALLAINRCRELESRLQTVRVLKEGVDMTLVFVERQLAQRDARVKELEGVVRELKGFMNHDIGVNLNVDDDALTRSLERFRTLPSSMRGVVLGPFNAHAPKLFNMTPTLDSAIAKKINHSVKRELDKVRAFISATPLNSHTDHLIAAAEPTENKPDTPAPADNTTPAAPESGGGSFDGGGASASLD